MQVDEDETLVTGVDVEVRAAAGRAGRGGPGRALAYTAGLGECGHPELWMGPDPTDGLLSPQRLGVEERARLLLQIAHAVLDGRFEPGHILTGPTEDGRLVARCWLGPQQRPPAALGRGLPGARVVRPVLWRLLDPDADLDAQLDAHLGAPEPPPDAEVDPP